MDQKNYLIILLMLYILYLKLPTIKNFILINLLVIDDKKNKIITKNTIFDKKIKDNLNKHISDKHMLEMCEYALIGGKKIRPLIFISIYKSITKNNNIPNYIYDLALVVEYLHCSSLILDDIMDGDYLRRDKLANFIKFGRSKSLLCSITICNVAVNNLLEGIEKLNEINSNQKISLMIIDFINQMIKDLTMGQYFDITNNDINIQDLIKKKTSSLFEFCFVIPWLCTNYNIDSVNLEEGINEMKYLGKLFGNIFQIADDFEDYYSDIEKNNVNIILKYNKYKSYQFYKKNVSIFQEYSLLYKVNNETLNDIITSINSKYYNLIF